MMQLNFLLALLCSFPASVEIHENANSFFLQWLFTPFFHGCKNLNVQTQTNSTKNKLGQVENLNFSCLFSNSFFMKTARAKFLRAPAQLIQLFR